MASHSNEKEQDPASNNKQQYRNFVLSRYITVTSQHVSNDTITNWVANIPGIIVLLTQYMSLESKILFSSVSKIIHRTITSALSASDILEIQERRALFKKRRSLFQKRNNMLLVVLRKDDSFLKEEHKRMLRKDKNCIAFPSIFGVTKTAYKKENSNKEFKLCTIDSVLSSTCNRSLNTLDWYNIYTAEECLDILIRSTDNRCVYTSPGTAIFGSCLIDKKIHTYLVGIDRSFGKCH
ncbi:MAG: hypothetical protein EOP34_10340 [Rickettsiales bacterium]|nr:MAG: hypothetical protein EOP34_10340 [Rickettsiales bacterium]